MEKEGRKEGMREVSKRVKEKRKGGSKMDKEGEVSV